MTTKTKRTAHRNQNRFRKTEARRLVRAVKEAGFDVARVEVDPATGKIAVIPGKAEAAAAKNKNPWDTVYEQN